MNWKMVMLLLVSGCSSVYEQPLREVEERRIGGFSYGEGEKFADLDLGFVNEKEDVYRDMPVGLYVSWAITLEDDVDDLLVVVVLRTEERMHNEKISCMPYWFLRVRRGKDTIENPYPMDWKSRKTVELNGVSFDLKWESGKLHARIRQSVDKKNSL